MLPIFTYQVVRLGCRFRGRSYRPTSRTTHWEEISLLSLKCTKKWAWWEWMRLRKGGKCIKKGACSSSILDQPSMYQRHWLSEQQHGTCNILTLDMRQKRYIVWTEVVGWLMLMWCRIVATEIKMLWTLWIIFIAIAELNGFVRCMCISFWWHLKTAKSVKYNTIGSIISLAQVEEKGDMEKRKQYQESF